MRTLIYSGGVMHTRHDPVRHEWKLPYCFFGFDVDELPEIDRQVKGFGYNRRRPVCLSDENYLAGSGGFRERLSRYVNLSGVERIVLVTAVGFFRRAFNPVSFYYCLKNDTTAAYMLAEVNNTYGDRHLYVLEGGDFPLKCSHEKLMHVSPFNDLKGRYEFSFSAPGEEVRISIRLHRDDRLILDTSIWGSGRPLSSASLRRMMLTHPLATAKTMPRIFWQAALLYYVKKLKFNKRPDPGDPMTIKVMQ